VKTRFDFAGQTVVVTGSCKGIGLAVARGFAGDGADLVMVDQLPEIEDVAASTAKEFGTAVRGFVCDITDLNAVRGVFMETECVDVLVNNAGLELMTPIDEVGEGAENTFARIININILGTYYVTRYALPKMGPGARIIITASIWSKTAVANFSAYCASKHANLGFMRSIAQELGPRGIRVNAVCPGFIRTEASMRTVAAEAKRKALSEDMITRDLLRAQAFEGLLEPQDVVSSYLFLASDFAADITGQSLHIDRGDVMD